MGGNDLRTATVPWNDRLARVAALAAAERAAIVAIGDDRLHVTAILGELVPDDWPERLGGGVIRRVAKVGTAIAIEVQFAVGDAESAFSSALLVPVRGEPDFVVALFRRTGMFTPEEVGRGKHLAAMLADLQEETRARIRATTQLERMDVRLRTMEELRPAFATASDAATLLQQAAQTIAERFNAASASVMLLDADGDLRVRASVGLAPHIARDARRRVGEGIAGWVASRRRGVLLRGPVDDGRFRGVDPEAGAALSVPLQLGDEVVGVLNVKRPREGTTFDETHLRALEAIGGDVASALRHVEAVARIGEDRKRTAAVGEIARLAQAGERREAARLACQELGFRAVAVETAAGLEILHATTGTALPSAGMLRFETPSGAVLFATSVPVAEESISLAERVAPLLARAEAPVRPTTAPTPAEPTTTSPSAVAAPQGTREPLRVFIVEDHPVMREGLRGILERDGDIMVCGTAQTLAEALASLEEARPGVVICDLRLPDAEDVVAVRRLSALPYQAPVVVFSAETAADAVRAALQAGARGFVPKRATPEALRAAVHAAASGILAVHPDLLPSLTVHTPHAPPEAEPAGKREPLTRETLTPRELEYLRYLAEGYTNKEIASAMVLAEDTVKKGIQTLIAKLGAVDRTHAVVIALRAAVIQ